MNVRAALVLRIHRSGWTQAQESSAEIWNRRLVVLWYSDFAVYVQRKPVQTVSDYCLF